MIREGLKYLISSKTVLMWIVIVMLGFVALTMSMAVLILFQVDNPYLNDFYNLLTGGGIGGTIRNVISDGVMPRIPQAVGAAKDPTVSVQPPMSMAHSDTKASNQYAPSIPRLE